MSLGLAHTARHVLEDLVYLARKFGTNFVTKNTVYFFDYKNDV